MQTFFRFKDFSACRLEIQEERKIQILKQNSPFYFHKEKKIQMFVSLCESDKENKNDFNFFYF